MLQLVVFLYHLLIFLADYYCKSFTEINSQKYDFIEVKST